MRQVDPNLIAYINLKKDIEIDQLENEISRLENEKRQLAMEVERLLGQLNSGTMPQETPENGNGDKLDQSSN